MCLCVFMYACVDIDTYTNVYSRVLPWCGWPLCSLKYLVFALWLSSWFCKGKLLFAPAPLFCPFIFFNLTNASACYEGGKRKRVGNAPSPMGFTFLSFPLPYLNPMISTERNVKEIHYFVLEYTLQGKNFTFMVCCFLLGLFSLYPASDILRWFNNPFMPVSLL